MKTIISLALVSGLCLVSFSNISYAKKAAESNNTCEKMTIVNGKQTYTPCTQSDKQPWEVSEEQEAAAKKSKCGKDFMALHVGMSFDRYQECNEEPVYVTETVSKNGAVIESYRGTFYFINVSGDRIVSYTKRPF